MSRKQKQSRGKVVHNEFVKRESYLNSRSFEDAIKERVSYLKSTRELYANQKIGTVMVFRNRRGARVIAYDLTEESK